MAPTLTKDSVFTAASGMKMPVVGLGTLVRTTEEHSSEEEIMKTIDYAIEAGYRHFDTAYMYQNEAAIGKALKKWLDSGKIKREELFIVSKLPMVAMNEKLVGEYLQRSLTALQLSYVDLYLIHKPVGFQPGEILFPVDDQGYLKLDYDTDHIALWKAMEAQVDAGRAKFIGLSDFTVAQMERILKSARIRPSTDQVECHLYFQRKGLREWGEKNGIPITSFASLGSPAAVGIFNKDGAMTEQQVRSPLTEDAVVRIAQAHNKTPGQVLLRHLLQLGIAVIPKSSNPDRIRQNIDVFDFELTDAEMAELNAIDMDENGRKFFVSNLVKGYDKHPECPYGKL
ncbi:1,5-anhydro-D-fructose reductase-like [Homalodisca vitripennis]|uniref:1,5-anhydro-D-fructose reductase-like n=1 Tax=Homalodisca vitripennis TaxID=197043 RepID=UPI001EEA94C8|nr:1,5-anhydro-D-fructose reductase-like [Homalodisca vitripennis]XP_046672899.1 1,5-anhydro-D-fructose reductase-like [Homalodisca vitripennis]XP_046672900.1 1,5-anhydro-D-fructose reductase-like [Homalodisca vitripennis]XP_046672901.1 1,5-anhydro-D-fructose reductase-like [Homalodisca vitripennis]XP_046672902.1 1,5-anhydro-D-fructose reductase-like [Homalodisca vitripennis]XP_046672903.1 1,5-anhydro-D-fructose reductase-like [Homalodisca vitripennis]